jgi:hypothetical protein
VDAPVVPLEPLDPLEPVAPVEPVEPVDVPVELPEDAPAVDPVDAEPVAPVDPAAPLEPVDPAPLPDDAPVDPPLPDPPVWLEPLNVLPELPLVPTVPWASLAHATAMTVTMARAAIDVILRFVIKLIFSTSAGVAQLTIWTSNGPSDPIIFPGKPRRKWAPLPLWADS